ncbi:MAG: PadR family transcriptional regulator [Actinomycetota bacterium]|nr:PadR family transcriptional regulator [Actinomycetota bacterium]
MDDMERQFFLGFIKIHILYHASREPVYGVWLMEELGRHGYRPSPGTLYPILHSLEKQGYLESYREAVTGKVRRYYSITALGGKALDTAVERINEMVDEVLHDREPRTAGRGSRRGGSAS